MGHRPKPRKKINRWRAAVAGNQQRTPSAHCAPPPHMHAPQKKEPGKSATHSTRSSSNNKGKNSPLSKEKHAGVLPVFFPIAEHITPLAIFALGAIP